MKKSSRYFYKYAKSKLKFKTPVGPFTDKEGNLINEKECETLNKQYQSVFGTPEPDDEINIEYLYSEEDLPSPEKRLEIVKFTITDIKKTVARINSESPGPSGVCPLILKKTKNTIVGYL